MRANGDVVDQRAQISGSFGRNRAESGEAGVNRVRRTAGIGYRFRGALAAALSSVWRIQAERVRSSLSAALDQRRSCWLVQRRRVSASRGCFGMVSHCSNILKIFHLTSR